MSAQRRPKAFFTDVFGTVVDWRTTVTTHLIRAASAKLNSSSSIPSEVRKLAETSISWPEFAWQWRKSYYEFTRSYEPDTMPFKTIDAHHLESLRELLQKHNLDGLWDEDEIQEISRIWHKLDPWSDSSPGIARISSKSTSSSPYLISTLSNGGQSLLADLASHGSLAYTHLTSAEDFKCYKPNPAVYQGGAKALGLAIEQCCMVAAHLGDLQAAKAQGMMTVYIERPQEEGWEPAKVEAARKDGWVDVWIGVGEGGFEEMARRFGV